MMNIISEVYGGKQEKKSGMLLYHKLVICSFVQLLKTGVSKEVSLGKVCKNISFKIEDYYSIYTFRSLNRCTTITLRFVKKENLPPYRNQNLRVCVPF